MGGKERGGERRGGRERGQVKDSGREGEQVKDRRREREQVKVSDSRSTPPVVRATKKLVDF